VYGGRAIPDIQYFDSDGLHLNDAGYSVWKQIVAVKIAESEIQLGKSSDNQLLP
jgi:lysophospholipase L1-like esterase